MVHESPASLRLEDGGLGMLCGEVEADETFIGGKARNMHIDERKRRITGTGGKDKTAVMGILERGGKVRTIVFPTAKRKLFSLRFASMSKPARHSTPMPFSHTKGSKETTRIRSLTMRPSMSMASVHTNGLENFWSLLKRGLSGTYVSVEPFHLFRYLDEQTYRYNNRNDMGDGDRFFLALSQITGKRLTYARLTGKDRAESQEPAPHVMKAAAQREAKARLVFSWPRGDVSRYHAKANRAIQFDQRRVYRLNSSSAGLMAESTGVEQVGHQEE